MLSHLYTNFHDIDKMISQTYHLDNGAHYSTRKTNTLFKQNDVFYQLVQVNQFNVDGHAWMSLRYECNMYEQGISGQGQQFG